MRHYLIAALILMAGSAQADNLVVDGGFESVRQASGSFSTYASLPGWTTTGAAGIEVRDDVAGSASEGDNFVELDSTANTSMAQTLATIAGANYLLTFDYSARGGVAADSNGIMVSWNGAPVATLALSGIGRTVNAWQSYGFNVTGTGSDTLSFAAVGTSDGLGGSLDAVSLDGISPTAAVPEPSTCALMIGGLALLGASIGKRRAAR